ncbi:hypothetical protein GPECTOR_2g1340 [Gonium pectorale]|uniref:Armadillo repeat-containing domain-containing protein n=1 Tax=Gonium pectorale TaxID=33097 RepID=A0A150H2H0_GONPE|nr:hypothetical protein GPECTOR_2g1340 [Gonium pectorale]|eukprot:KXZ55790.1 hypothetical protein GPECTOR_2g1340 [Gonium pectorale]
MAPKPDAKGKGKGKKGKKKTNKPAWMSDGLWELSQNLPKLSEFYSGDIKDTKLKEGQAPPPNITRTQAGMFIWQLVFPSNKAGKQKRDECVKFGIVETSVKILASGKAPDMTPALGILVALTADNPQQRGVMMDAKPAPLPNLLSALGDESASLRAAACALLRVVSREPDTRPRLWRLMRADWDWSPLVACLDLTEMSQLGGRSACYDAAATLEAMCCAPEQDIANGACAALMAANGPAHMVKSAGGLGLSLAQGGAGDGTGIEVPNIDLLDDETREQVVARARHVAGLDGVLKSLVKLCAGPEGPLPDLEALAAEGAPPPDDGKKKKKKGKKGKKPKMEPGTLEAQTYASAVLRLSSLAEEQRSALVEAGALRYLLPLLDAKNSAARWNARQTLINLSLAPELLPKLQLYKVPDYVHQANVPSSHFERPLAPPAFTTTAVLQHQDSLGRKKDGVAGVVAKAKQMLKAK